MKARNIGEFIYLIKNYYGEMDFSPVSSSNENRSVIASPVGKVFDFWYRGERGTNLVLKPKVFRGNYYEQDLTNRFRVLSRSRSDHQVDYNNYGMQLSIMQHYEIPTRLLDWSTSPLVALYFAVEKYLYDDTILPIDACVWILDPYVLNKSEINIDSTPSIEGDSVRKYLRPAFTNYSPAHPDEKYIEPDADIVCAVMAAESDKRIFAQQGCFTVHTKGTDLNRRIVNKNQNKIRFLDRIIIPSDAVKQIAYEI